MFYAGAVEGQMPEILSMIQVSKMTPAPGVLIVAILSLGYLCSSDIFALINYVGFATWVSIGLAVLCIPWLRWKHPEWARPIKVSMIWPVLYILATIFITVVPMIAKPFETGMGCVIILTAVPVYFIFIKWKTKPTFVKRGLSKNEWKIISEKFLNPPYFRFNHNFPPESSSGGRSSQEGLEEQKVDILIFFAFKNT